MKQLLCATAVLLTAAASSAAAGQGATAPGANAPPAPQDADQAAAAALQSLDIARIESDRAYAGTILGHLDHVATRTPSAAESLDLLRLLALVTLQRGAEAQTIMDRMAARRSNDPDVYVAIWVSALRLSDQRRSVAAIVDASRNVLS